MLAAVVNKTVAWGNLLGFTATPAMRDELWRRLQAGGVNVPRAVYDSAAGLLDRALTYEVVHFVVE